MIHVSLVTNYMDTCGIAIYGENLVKYASEKVFYHIIPPSSLEFALEESKECDIIHINYHEGLRFGFDLAEFIQKIKKPTILTNHTAEHAESWYDLLDVIVTHMEVPNDLFKRNIVIHHGILDFELDDIMPDGIVMAQAGFPFKWKNYHLICQSANKFIQLGIPGGVGIYFVIPNSYHGNANAVIQECKSILHPDVRVEFETNWLTDEEIIRNLHNKATVMVYYTEEKREGPSGSVRMGVSSKRPVVVNGMAYQYKDIINEQGIFPVFQPEVLDRVILEAHYSNTYAQNLIKKDNFPSICRQYTELYESLI